MLAHWFRAPNGAQSVCGVEVGFVDPCRIAVLLIELRDNPGMSVTNAAKQIARELVEAVPLLRGLPLERVAWYETREEPGVDPLEWAYDELTFPPDGPRWRRLPGRPPIRTHP